MRISVLVYLVLIFFFFGVGLTSSSSDSASPATDVSGVTAFAFAAFLFFSACRRFRSCCLLRVVFAGIAAIPGGARVYQVFLWST